MVNFGSWVPMVRRRLAAVLNTAKKENDYPVLDALLRGTALFTEAKVCGLITPNDLTKASRALYKTVDCVGLREIDQLRKLKN